MEGEEVQWTHLQFISFAIAHVVLLIVHLLKRRSGGAIANESTVRLSIQKNVFGKASTTTKESLKNVAATVYVSVCAAYAP